MRHDSLRGGAALIGLLTTSVLLLTAGTQVFDTNFYALWEAAALLQGDHPYRDFFEWGIPLHAAISAIVQWVAGYRLIGEFVLQWSGIVAGAMIAFRLGHRASGSPAATWTTSLVALIVLAATPIYHFSKLLFFPLAIWLAWRYLDRPTAGRGAAAGLATAAAFLVRHDLGGYLGVASVAAFVVARFTVPTSRARHRMAIDAAAYAGTIVICLSPWAVIVHANEGLPEYVRGRLEFYATVSPGSPYAVLRTFNPLPVIFKELPRPQPGTLRFEWHDDVDDRRRRELEQRLGLKADGPPDGRRQVYAAPNTIDPELMLLRHEISNEDGFDWERIEELASPLPPRDVAARWLEQISLVVPLLVMVGALARLVRAARRSAPPGDAWHMLLAAAFLALVDARLFREPSYVQLVAPLTAAFAARGLSAPGAAIWRRCRWGVAAALLMLTAMAAISLSRAALAIPILEAAPGTLRGLLVTPPIDAYAPAAEVQRWDAAVRDEADPDRGTILRILIRYLYECTGSGDRVLVTGSTPFQVNYYVERGFAGGHLFWHQEWLSGPAREETSLRLLRSQRVPFAISTSDPVMADLEKYPNIHRHFAEHYREVEGSAGLALVDRRLEPTGRFGIRGLPCFAR